MINKITLQSIIYKYHLDGLVESVKWEIKNKTLIINFISINGDLLGNLTYNNFPLEDTKFAIFNTAQFNKLVSVTLGDLILEVISQHKIASKLKISDSQFNVNYALADINMIKSIPEVEEPSEYNVVIKLKQEDTTALIKAKNAVGDSDMLIIDNLIDADGNKLISFIFGDNSDYSNKITYSIPSDSQLENKLPFSSNNLRGILTSNKDMSEGIISISNEGLMKLSFVDNKNLSTTYFIVRKEDL